MVGRKMEENDVNAADIDEEALLPLLSHRSSKPIKQDGAGPTTILGRIGAMAGPLALQNVFSYALSVISAIAVGQLNNPGILSAVVLAGSFFNVTGLSLVIGLSAGCDTIAGQAYGAKNYMLVGETLQRAILICWTICLPILLLWSYAAPVMAAMKQSPEIIAGAAKYLHIVGPSLFMSALSQNINKYLVSQRVVQPGSVCTAITALLCPLFNWFLIYKLQWGLVGAGSAYLASTSTYTSLMIGAVIWQHTRTQGTPEHTWPGFTSKAFRSWGAYLQYGIPAAAMICCEWWVFELVILMAGSLPNAEVGVAVMGVTFHVTSMAYMLPMSVGTAVNTCIANELGAGNAKAAGRYAITGIGVVACMQAVMGTGLWLGRTALPRLFTGAEDVLQLTSHVMPVVATCVLCDGMNSVCGGVLRGCGRQTWGAALNLIGYWCVGLPLAIILGFKLKWETYGFWTALAVASTLQACIQLVFISRIDWQQEVKRALDLVGSSDFARSAAAEPAMSSMGGTSEKSPLINRASFTGGDHSGLTSPRRPSAFASATNIAEQIATDETLDADTLSSMRMMTNRSLRTSMRSRRSGEGLSGLLSPNVSGGGAISRLSGMLSGSFDTSARLSTELGLGTMHVGAVMMSPQQASQETFSPTARAPSAVQRYS